MLDIINYGKPAGRCVITPPGVDKEKINFLRKIVADCYKDPEFVSRATKMGLNVNPMTGEEAEDGVAKTLEITPEEVKWLKYTLYEKYINR
jgi:tripartite-type tricarboxylate transporter receptor subunit TctC